MQWRGGKQICMDEPPPPEYELPMTPVTLLDGSGTELQEPYTPYTPYNNQPATPLHTGRRHRRQLKLGSASKKQEQARPHRLSKTDIRVVRHSRLESRGRKHLEDSMPLSSEPSIQEDTSLSQHSMRFSSVLSSIPGSEKKQKRGFLSSTHMFGSSD